MTQLEGWIKLHRKILQSDMYRSLNSKQRDVVMVILLMANHKENQWEYKGEIYTAGPGQFVTSLDSIHKNCAKDVSIQNIRTALLKLEKWGFLTSKSTNKNRLITVVNWEVYQPSEKNQQANEQATNKQLTTNKNEKNEKKKDNRRKYDDDSSFMKMAQYMLRKIQEWNEGYKVKNVQKWADDFRKIVELDKRDKHLVKQVIDWATSHSFWQSNILSPEKLRKQFDTLKAQMTNQEQKNNVVPFEDKREKARNESMNQQVAVSKWIQVTNRDPDENFIKWYEEGAKIDELASYVT